MSVDQFFEAARMSRPQILTMALQGDNCCLCFDVASRRRSAL